jgi:hypothetical protein
MTYAASGLYTFPNSCGADTLNLTITPITGSTIPEAACDSFVWLANDVTYFASGQYYHTVGCNTDTLDLTITPSSGSSLVASACDSYIWAANSATYSASGQYYHTVGCNTDTLDLTITPSSGSTLVAAACDSYTWATNGVSYSASGLYFYTVGCNTDTLDLTITPSSGSSLVASACDSYTWAANGVSYSASGQYYHTVGCNTDTLDLTITPSSGTYISQSACGSFFWPTSGMTYTASGLYTFPNSCGADTLNLTITPITGSTIPEAACDSFVWLANDVTYFASGQYYHTVGCNTDTLDLTIDSRTGTTTTRVVCDSYTWRVNGITYTVSGTHLHTVGCHTDTLVDEYLWTINGMTYTAGGVYMHTVDCHTETLELTINQSSGSTTVISAQGSYTWAVNGQTYTQSGTYTNTGINAANCPHVDTLSLNILPAAGTVCSGLITEVRYERLGNAYVQAGANSLNTFYNGLSSGGLRAIIRGGVGPFEYNWTNSEGYSFRNNNNVSQRVNINPLGPSWIMVEITDLGNGNCKSIDSLYLDWEDLTCLDSSICLYTLSRKTTQSKICIMSVREMRDSIITGNWDYGACIDSTLGCGSLSATIRFEKLNNYWINAGANQPNTYYQGLSNGMLWAHPLGGVGPFSYQWSETAGGGFWHNMSNGLRAQLFYPQGPTWVKVVVTDHGNNNCNVTDSVLINWVDYTCNNPSFPVYSRLILCNPATQTTICSQSLRTARDSVITGNWILGACITNQKIIPINEDMIELKLYPLPTQKQIFLEFNRDMDHTTYLEILNLNGKIMYQTEFEKLESGQPHSLDVGFLSAGMYLLRISNLEFNAVKRFEVIR